MRKGRKRGVHRKRRPRRPLPGMLLHLDGSQHRWFQDERWYDLIVILDDATSEIYYAQLVEEESTRTVMAALREVVEQKGCFCVLYSGGETAQCFRGSTPNAGCRQCREALRWVEGNDGITLKLRMGFTMPRVQQEVKIVQMRRGGG